MSPVDAARLGVKPNSVVEVRSRRGHMTARAFVTHTVQPKQVFIPMHFARTNQLTFAAFDKKSRQPAYKACAVKVTLLDDKR
jgi:assimilatory nitrate reductase catalytic subunit